MEVLAGHPSSYPLNPSSKPTKRGFGIFDGFETCNVGIGLSLCDAQSINLDRENPTHLMILDLKKTNQGHQKTTDIQFFFR